MVRATQIPSAMAAPTTTLATARVQVLPPPDSGRFTALRGHGFKKSTLIARLVREYLEREEFKESRTRRTKRIRTGRGTRGI
jgi:hypothetical protein